MAVEITCPYCRNSFAGSRVKCPFCGMSMPQRLRAQAAAAREEERRRREADAARRASEKAQSAQTKEAKRQYQQTREEEAAAMTEAVRTQVVTFESLLAQTLEVDDAITFEELKDKTPLPEFDGGALTIVEPPPPEPHVAYLTPPEPRGLERLMPGWRKKYAAKEEEARKEHDQKKAQASAEHAQAVQTHANRESERLAKLEEARRAHAEAVAQLEEERAEQHSRISEFERVYLGGDRDAIVRYFSLVLERSPYPEDIPRGFRIAYVPESRQLVVERELPGLSAIPEAREFRYIKANDEIKASPRPGTERKKLYASVAGQMVLRTVHELFEADRPGFIDTVVLNAFVDTIDPRTGQAIRPYLVTVRTDRDSFEALDLAQVEPLACLKALHAGVSKSPAELLPIRPVLEFNMVDPRFVEESDVLSSLEQRPNLMELTPGEFEALITNLFERMGLETRMTQASRDGGVDCVAYDPRPIFGGKVVIQAKRYKGTVGVSAVRDLFGTMQNEGASKGILVTTSGYGKASFEFADGKPLELLSGSNLLYLLKEHAEMDARIEPPEDWVDPSPELLETD
jgi:restriction system protein